MPRAEDPTRKTDQRPAWVRAQFLQVGHQLFTPDGWQTIIGTLISQDTNQVVVWTPECPDDDRNDIQGWRYRFDEVVRRRGEVPPTKQCPEWCVEHYQAGERMEQSNHASFPQSITVTEACTGKTHELGFWLERRDDRETGDVETVGILEIARIGEDVELPPEDLRRLAAQLVALADTAEENR